MNQAVRHRLRLRVAHQQGRPALGPPLASSAIATPRSWWRRELKDPDELDALGAALASLPEVPQSLGR